MAISPSIWRDNDPARAVSKPDAIAAWSDAAWSVLQDVASRYGGYVTDAELGRRLQAVAGVHTSMHLEHWLRDALEPVSQRIRADPSRAPLTSLVVQPDGRAPRWFASRGRPAFRSAADRETAAAADRLECYRAHATNVPDDAHPMPVTVAPTTATTTSRGRAAGGSAARSGRASGARATASPRRTRPEDRPVAVCPTCHMQLRPDGTCDLCD